MYCRIIINQKHYIMKKALFIIAVLLGIACSSQLNAQNTLKITVTGVKKTIGSVLVSLFDSSTAFMKKGLASQKIEVKGDTVEIIFDDLPEGEYAVTLFHDDNDNGKMDTGQYGIPAEAYGFSNNAKATYGPPKYDACKFEVKGDTAITIQLQ